MPIVWLSGIFCAFLVGYLPDPYSSFYSIPNAKSWKILVGGQTVKFQGVQTFSESHGEAILFRLFLIIVGHFRCHVRYRFGSITAILDYLSSL